MKKILILSVIILFGICPLLLKAQCYGVVNFDTSVSAKGNSTFTIPTRYPNELIMISYDGWFGPGTGPVKVDGIPATHINTSHIANTGAAVVYAYSAPLAGTHTVACTETGYTSPYYMNFAAAFYATDACEGLSVANLTSIENTVNDSTGGLIAGTISTTVPNSMIYCNAEINEGTEPDTFPIKWYPALRLDSLHEGNGIDAGDAYLSTPIPRSYTISAQNHAPCCVEGQGGLTLILVVISPPPCAVRIALSDTNPTCENNNGTAIASVSGGASPFTYSWTPIGGTNAIATGLSAGTYTVTVTSANNACPVVTDSVIISGSVALINFTDVLCDRDSSGTATIIITRGKPPYTYLWSNGSTNQQDTGLGTGEYHVTVTDSLGCRFKDSVAISVYHALPISVRPPSDSICVDSSITLTASGANTYRWSPATGLSCYSCPSPVATPTATITYTVTGTDLHGCINTTTVPIKVLAKPIPAINGNDSVCKGNSIILRAGGGTGYVWYPGANTNSSFTVSPQVTTVYTLTASNGICSRDTTFKVTVIPYPTPSITVTKDSLCPGDSSTISGSGGMTYKWSPGNSTNATIHINPANTTTYTLYVSNYECTDSAVQKIKIIPAPVISVSSSADSICPSGTAILSVSSTGQATYKWSTGATSSTISVSPSVTTTYTATVYGTCDSAQKFITVGLYSSPVPAISGATWKCKGVTDTLMASGGSNYRWSNGSTGNIYITKGIDADSTVYVTVISNHGCLASDSFHITLINPPVATFTSSPSVCPGQCITLISTPNDSGYTFLWSNLATTDTTTVCPKRDSTFSVTVTNACGKNKATTKVNVYSSSLLVCCDTIINKGSSVTLSANSSKRYSWVPNTDLNCDTCQTVIATPTITTTYTVTGEYGDHCTDISLVTVTVEILCFDFTVPNVFTPNGDGINDYFHVLPKTINEPLNFNSYSLVIYNRWGKEMYKSTDPTQYWNGNTENGEQACDGIYYYIITSACSDNTYNKNGFVQLIR